LNPIWALVIAILSSLGGYYIPKLISRSVNSNKSILTYHFNGDSYRELKNIKHSFGRGVDDIDASNGKAWEHTSQHLDGGETTCYGPYTKEISFRGKYKARFRIKLCGIKEDADIITLDIAYGEVDTENEKIRLGIVSGERHLRTKDFSDGKYKDFDVGFEYNGESLLEFRCTVINPVNFTNVVGRILFDNVKVFLVSELT
jgi:hypothetical protein